MRLIKLMIIGLMLIVSSVSVLGAVTYTWSNDTQNLFVQGAGEENISFEDIYDYVNDNSVMPTNLISPMIYGNELTENNSGEWVLYASDNTSRYLGNVSGISLSTEASKNNYSINISFNGTGDKTIGWNTNQSYVNTNYGALKYLPINVMKTMNFVIKTNNPDINLTDIRISSYLGESPLIRQEGYWRYSNITSVNINETWINVTITLNNDFYSPKVIINHFITDETVYGHRFYWAKLSRIYFSFEGGADGDYILLDNLHFESGDLNPEKIGYKNYEFKTPTSIETNFYDYDFTVTFNYLGKGIYGERGFYAYAYGGETITFGTNFDEERGSLLGGNFIVLSEESGQGGNDINHQLRFYASSNSIINLNSIRIYPIGSCPYTDYYQGSELKFDLGSINSIINLNNVEIFNVPDFFLNDFGIGNNYFNVKDVKFHGGRYPFRTFKIIDNLNVDGFTIYGSSDDYGYVSVCEGSVKGLKLVYEGTNLDKKLLYIRDYGADHNMASNYVNLDLTEMNIPDPFAHLYCRYTNYNCSMSLSATIDIRVVNNDGEFIPDVNINITDNLGNTYFNITDVNGMMEEQTIDYYLMETTGIEIGTFALKPDYESTVWTVGTLLYPFTISLTHPDYPDKSFIYNITSKTDWVINLEDDYPWEVNGLIHLKKGDGVVHVTKC